MPDIIQIKDIKTDLWSTNNYRYIVRVSLIGLPLNDYILYWVYGGFGKLYFDGFDKIEHARKKIGNYKKKIMPLSIHAVDKSIRKRSYIKVPHENFK